MTTPPNLTIIATEIVADQLAGKIYYKSKTFWVNVVALAALGAQMQYGYVIGADLQALILSLINLGLRSITKEPILWN